MQSVWFVCHGKQVDILYNVQDWLICCLHSNAETEFHKMTDDLEIYTSQSLEHSESVALTKGGLLSLVMLSRKYSDLNSFNKLLLE